MLPDDVKAVFLKILTDTVNSKNCHFIYNLQDPRDGEIRYVGITKIPHNRLSQHKSESRTSYSNQNKNAWMADLLISGSVPKMNIIDLCESTDASSCEEAWIDYYRKQGCELLNSLQVSNTGSTEYEHRVGFKRDRLFYSRPKTETAKEAHNRVFNSQDLSTEMKKREKELKSFKLNLQKAKKEAPKPLLKMLESCNKYLIINLQLEPQKCSY